MKTKALGIQLGLLLLCVGLLNGGVHRAAQNSRARQVTRLVTSAPLGTTLFLGNSLVEAGIEPTAFPAEWRAVNGGLGSSTPVEHFLLWRAAASRKPQRVVYGYFDTLLTDRSTGGWDALVGNRALSYHGDLALAQELYEGTAPLLPVIARIPMLVERQQVWAKVEQLRRKVGGIGLPKAAENQFGRVADFAALEQNAATFRQKCAALPPLSKPIVRLTDEATQAGAEVVFVLMPMPQAHRTQFYESIEWHRYHDGLTTALLARNARVIDASAWVPDGGFSDVLHLNSEGAAKFCQRLQRELAPGH